MRVAVDVMGGDKAPAAILRGCWEAAPLLDAKDTVLLVGDQDVIRKGLSYTATGEYKLEIASGARARCEAKDSARKVGVVWGPNTSLADGKWHQVVTVHSTPGIRKFSGCPAHTLPSWRKLAMSSIVGDL